MSLHSQAHDSQGIIPFQHLDSVEKAEHPWKAYTYTWEYLPKKQSGKHVVGCLNDNDFFRLIATWNKSNPDKWKYTADPTYNEHKIAEAMTRD